MEEQKPNPNVEAPPLRQVTESYKPYSYFEELEAEWKKEREDHPVKTLFKDIYYVFYRFFRDTWYNRRWFVWGWQRARKGFCDRDVWSFDYYLCNVIVGGLKHLKKYHAGIPAEFVDQDGNGYDEGNKKWMVVLDDIIWTFETAKKIIDADYWLVEDEGRREEVRKTHEGKKYDIHVMTKEEINRYYKGWSLFKKYFFNLWD